MEMCAKIAWLPGIIHIVRLIYGESILDAGHISLLTERQVKKQLDTADLVIEEEFKMGCYMPIIAELLGTPGRAFAQFMESAIRGTFLDWSLWTQLYVLKQLDGTETVPPKTQG